MRFLIPWAFLVGVAVGRFTRPSNDLYLSDHVRDMQAVNQCAPLIFVKARMRVIERKCFEAVARLDERKKR